MVRIRVAGVAGVVVLLASTFLCFGKQPGAKDSPKAATHETKSNFITRTFDLQIRDNSASEAFPGLARFLGHVYVRVTDADDTGLLNRKALYAVGSDVEANITLEADGFVKKVGDNGGIGDMTLDEQGRRNIRQWRVINVVKGINKIRVTVAGIQDETPPPKGPAAPSAGQ